jgi:polyphosphate:AMP phosphotransferase
MMNETKPGELIDEREFKQLELSLRRDLLDVQSRLLESEFAVIIFVGGLEGAGKGSLAQRLNEWMDPRHIETHSYWDHSDEEDSRPEWWRYWRRQPRHGTMALHIGGWYIPPIYGLLEKTLDDRQLERACERINATERMMTEDGVRIIKLWLQVGAEFQQMQLAEEAPPDLQLPRVPQRIDHNKVKHEAQMKAATAVLKMTSTAHCPWELVDGEHLWHRDVRAGQIILRELQSLFADSAMPAVAPADFRASDKHALADLDLTQSLNKRDYSAALDKYQARLQDQAWQARADRVPTVAVFEGWDAAGKGSAIRRVTGAIDPRLYTVVQVAAPNDEERAHHYLWRFWRRLSRDGRFTIFDRSWYGRVLVERVEQLTPAERWQRAYEEINEFEHQLVEHGTVLLKFWLHISPEEQLKRFRERERLAHKQHKITEDDWRNRDRWGAYQQAVEDMISYTSTEYAPWTLVEGNNKRHARIRILRTFYKALKQRE